MGSSIILSFTWKRKNPATLIQKSCLHNPTIPRGLDRTHKYLNKEAIDKETDSLQEGEAVDASTIIMASQEEEYATMATQTIEEEVYEL